MRKLNLLLFALLECLCGGKYPQDALQCYSSSALKTQTDGELICPLDARVCVKEEINATRKDCGNVEGSLFYRRDIWDRKLAKCVYRKCSSRCPSQEEQEKRVFIRVEEKLGDNFWNRTSYCCDSNLCNVRHRTQVTCGFLLVVLWLFVS